MTEQGVRVAVLGAAGRMGRAVIEAAADEPGLQVVAAVERAGSSMVGAASGAPGISICEDLSAVPFDVAVDFSSPGATLGAMDACRTQHAALVTGTTGLDAAQQRQLELASADLAICQAANFSVGVNVVIDLLGRAARALGDGYDVEIVEAHHRHKVDAPSGTALRMGREIADALDRDLDAVAVYGRQGQTGARDPAAIGFATVRGGDVVGDHSALFLGDGERVEIGHRASGRQNFARGALRAAAWLRGKPPGLYAMREVLGL